MATLIWIIIVIGGWWSSSRWPRWGARRRRTAMLRDRFGPEYDRAVEKQRRPALRRRPAFAIVRSSGLSSTSSRCRRATGCASRGSGVTCRSASSTSRLRAAAGADALVTRVMEARGYPMTDFGAQADLVSVDHPGHRRELLPVRPRGCSSAPGLNRPSTEDLREALLRVPVPVRRTAAPGRQTARQARPESRRGACRCPAGGPGPLRLVPPGQVDDPEAGGKAAALAGPTAPRPPITTTSRIGR